MTAIWEDAGDGWKVATPAGFPAEAALHDLVEQSPQLMPLAGAPTLAILGREVRLGAGYADLVAVETTGRPVVIEVKLAYNAEARRAVISQILTYAAFLYGLELSAFEDEVLAKHLRSRGHSCAFDAATAADQVGSLERTTFDETLAQSLRTGEFRLVIVLDAAPTELQDLVGYLEAVADRLTIDLVTVQRFEIGGSSILVPQRVEPGRRPDDQPAVPTVRRHEGYEVPGADDFVARIASAPESERPTLTKLAGWAQQLHDEGLVNLSTFHGKGDERLTLLPRLPAENAGLVTIWNDTGSAYIAFWRSVFERCAPKTLERLAALVAPREIGRGTTTRDINDELLEVLTDAHREAAGRVSP